jgi:hypothetical protein
MYKRWLQTIVNVFLTCLAFEVAKRFDCSPEVIAGPMLEAAGVRAVAPVVAARGGSVPQLNHEDSSGAAEHRGHVVVLVRHEQQAVSSL